MARNPLADKTYEELLEYCTNLEQEKQRRIRGSKGSSLPGPRSPGWRPTVSSHGLTFPRSRCSFPRLPPFGRTSC